MRSFFSGEMKRKQPDLDEASIMMLALQSEVPRLVVEDVPIYVGLVADIFPGQPLAKASNDLLKSTFEEVLRERRLQDLPTFVEKGMQLYQTQLLRHGLLVVRKFFQQFLRIAT